MNTTSILLLAALLVALYFLLRFNKSYNKSRKWSEELWTKNQNLNRKNEVLQSKNNLQTIYYKTKSKDQLFVEIRVLSQDAADDPEVLKIIQDYFAIILKATVFVRNFLEIIHLISGIDTFNSRQLVAKTTFSSALISTKNNLLGRAYASSIIEEDDEAIAVLKDILNDISDNDSSYFLLQLKIARNVLDDCYQGNMMNDSNVRCLEKVKLELSKIKHAIKLLEDDLAYKKD